MRPDPIRRFGPVFLVCAALAALLVFTADDPVKEENPASTLAERLSDAFRSDDPFDRIATQATLAALDHRYYDKGEDVRLGCVEYGDISFLLHPDTDPAVRERLLREMREFYSSQNKTNYYKVGRWTTTATDGSVPNEGTPVTLLWAYLPDGVTIPSSHSGEATSPSILNAVFDTAFTSPSTWKNKINNAFVRWDNILGSTYINVAYDDGASFPSSAGVVGTRADIRIGGHPIDGPSNILAYNFFPNTGDMVLDTDDYGYYSNPSNNYKALKNTVMHEHGHGMGLGHVTPLDLTKLMEAIASLSQPLGPQDDDTRGGQRLYGDWLEPNPDVASASNLGAVVDTLVVDNLSIHKGTTDEDFYLVTMSSAGIDIVVTPVGSTYDLGIDGGAAPTPISTDSINDLDVELYDNTGSTLLASATGGSFGATETISGAALPGAGDYIIRVFRKAGAGGGLQRYSLKVRAAVPSGIDLADRGVPTAPVLGVVVAPNPFNPKATIRFNAPSAGAYSVDIYDISGRLVQSIPGRASSAGPVELTWDGTDRNGEAAASGIYLMNVSAAGVREVRRATLVR